MPADRPPEGAGWSHEVKYRGDRIQIQIRDGNAWVFAENGEDWTDRCGLLLQEALRLPCETAVIDGQLLLQIPDRIIIPPPSAQRSTNTQVTMAFDLVELDGEDLRHRTLERRRELLAKLIGPNDAEKHLRHSDHVVGGGPSFFAAMSAMGEDGMISKRVGSYYCSGACDDWMQTRCFTERECILIGLAQDGKERIALLAAEENGRLHYTGRAKISLPGDERDRLQQAAEALSIDGSAVPIEAECGITWMQPVIRARVRTLRGKRDLRRATLLCITTPPMTFG